MIKKGINGILSVFLLALIALSMSSCTTQSTGTNEANIVSDITSRDHMFGSYSLQVDSSEIIKRQTNPDLKTDYVWVQVKGSNDIFNYNGQYYLEYVLYNEGWMLEDYSQTSSEYQVKNYDTVTESSAEQEIRSLGYDQWELVERKELLNCVQFTYNTHNSRYYMETDYSVSIYFSFTPSNNWNNVEHLESFVDEKWDILGVWKYRDNENDLYVNIIDVDLKSDKITLEYDLDMTLTHGFNEGDRIKRTSNGIIRRDFIDYSEYQRFVDEPDDEISSIWVCAGELGDQDPGGTGSGVTVNGYWLVKQ